MSGLEPLLYLEKPRRPVLGLTSGPVVNERARSFIELEAVTP